MFQPFPHGRLWRSKKCMAKPSAVQRTVVKYIILAALWISVHPGGCLVYGIYAGINARVQISMRANQQQVKSLPRLPLGMDSFMRLREERRALVDKTRKLVALIKSGDQHLLARPRRFGKTLLLDTTKCIFMDSGQQKERAKPKYAFQQIQWVFASFFGSSVCHVAPCLTGADLRWPGDQQHRRGPEVAEARVAGGVPEAERLRGHRRQRGIDKCYQPQAHR